MSLNILQATKYSTIKMNGKQLFHVDAYSIGYPPRTPYHWGVNINGEKAVVAGRGWGIAAWNTNGELIASTSYDTLGDSSGSTATNAANFFKLYNKDGNLIVVHTQDEPGYYSGNFVNYLESASVGFKTIRLVNNAFRVAWCGIYQHGKGPLAEECSAAWTGSGTRTTQANSEYAECGCNATLVL